MRRCDRPNDKDDKADEADCSDNHQTGSGKCEWMFAKNCAKYQQEAEQTNEKNQHKIIIVSESAASTMKLVENQRFLAHD